MPNDHPLMSKSVIDIEDLQDETLVCGEPGEQSQRMIAHELEANGITPRKIWNVSLGEMATRLVANGTGLAILNSVSAYDAKRYGVETRPISFTVDYDFQIIVPLEKNVEREVSHVNLELRRLVEGQMQQSLILLGASAQGWQLNAG